MKEKIEKLGKKRIILVGCFLLLIIIILFGGAFIYNKFFYKKSYTEIEQTMEEYAREYIAKNSTKLEIKETLTLSESELTNSTNMKTIAEYLKDESTTCTAEVNVTNMNGTYRYTPILDCGKKYQTDRLVDYVIKKTRITETGAGLYNLNDELVYRGETVNNYLKLSDKIYRIVKFTDEQAVIILTDKENSTTWDNRYNIEKNNNVGINNYQVSRVKETLQELYKGTELLTNKDKLMVIPHDIGIGKREEFDTSKDGSVENSVILENQYIGLLQLNDYLNASIDINCVNSVSPSCENYNYLAKYHNSWWTITGTPANSYQVYKINKTAELKNTSSSARMRPVLYLTKDTLYVSGEGTRKSPYIVK